MLLYVDTIDACNLKCPTCVRGSGAFPNTNAKMPLELFRKIIKKAKKENVHQVDLFNWIEPFLNKDLHEFTQCVKEERLGCGIATALSLRSVPNIEKTLSNTDFLTVTVSGLDQKVYEINHVGGNINYVKHNLEIIAGLVKSRKIPTKVTLRFLKFDYNSDQEKKISKYASELGLQFETLPASGHPIKWPLGKKVGDQFRDRLANFSAERPFEKKGNICPLIFEHVALNYKGEIFLCCAYGNFDFLKIGPYLELSQEEILWRRYTHPMCHSCDWQRRPATHQEKELLINAFQKRIDPIIQQTSNGK